MSRKLDAMFYEKLLGFEVWHQEIILSHANTWYGGPNDGWYMRHKGGHVVVAGGILTMPEAHKSLDVGMQGVDSFGADVWFELAGPWKHRELQPWTAHIQPDSEYRYTGEGKTRPLAVVKACLLAKGVSAEKIERAEKGEGDG